MRTRAYSFIEIKSFDDKNRIVEGIASTPTPDRMQDTVNPLGAKFTLPIPFLWQHQHSSPIGNVIDAEPTKKGIPYKAQVAQTDEPGTLKDRLDEAWQSLKLRLVRATSIGFNPLKWSFIENGGMDFEEWDWLELTAVTVPANPEAEISAVKRFDRIFREAEGIPEFEYPEIPAPPTEAAAPGKKTVVVKLDAPARDRAPFVINKIHPARPARS
jgi:HK97 family phage prohead protease